MALITPRRRFLITAPLALLLPAGLLTYLGLQVVNGIEARYEEQVNEEVQEIVNTVRNQTSLYLRYNIQRTFREALESQVLSEISPNTDLEEFEFTANHPLPFVSKIYLYRPMEKIHFFVRKQSSNSNNSPRPSSTWVTSQRPDQPFIDRLRSEMDILVFQNEPMQDHLFRSDFETLSYPEDVMSDANRELTCFAPYTEVPNPSEDDIIIYGFTFDFDSINNAFFPQLLEDLWQTHRELKDPIRITDYKYGRPVATVPMNRPMGTTTFKESLKHHSRRFHDDFPWYRIYFSKQIGQDTMEIANNEKILFYCLIASADIIMVLGLFGALRNIAKELEISDMRSDFVARISHELRTPLGLIRLYAETLEMDRTKDEKKRKEYLRSITKESERLSHLINNILNFSLIEAEKKQYSMVETQIEDVVYETVETIHYHMERYGFELDIHIDENLPAIECDPDSIQQAIYNLLTNAMKYSGDSREIHIDAKQQNGEIVIDVADHGIGISPMHQKKIFQEFYRVDDPRVQETGGSGLGLALVKHIAEGHGGRLTVASELGKGSTFSLHLPIKRINLN